MRLDGEGEDPAVRALKDIPEGSNLQDLDIAAALYEIIRGQKVQSDQLNKLRERMDQMDKAAEKWETQRQRFIDDVMSRAESLKVSPEKQAEIMAREGNKLTGLITKAKASAVNDRLRLEEAWAHEAKETVTSPGVMQIINTGQGQRAQVVPETLIIRHKTWVFQPGIPTEVPRSVAEQLRRRRQIQAETAERQAILQRDPSTGKLMEARKLDNEMAKIDAKYKSHTDRLPQ